MKRKVLALLMVVAMLASLSLLSACAGTETPAPAATTAAPAPAATTAAPAPAATTAAPAPAAIDPLTIKFNATYQETETGGQLLKYFIEKLGTVSGGAIKVNISWGGTLFTSPDELDAVIDGSVDMVALGHMPHLNTLPYLSFPPFAPGGTKGAVDYFDTLMFKDPVTSKLIQDEATAVGVKYLNVLAGGANAFCAKYAFTDLASLVKGSASFGNMDSVIFEALGFKVTTVFPPEAYDALNRGLIDATQMGFAPMVAMSWYEPAPFWALDSTYAAGNFFTANLKWWNALTDAQKKAIQQAADETQAYSITIYDDAIAKDIAMVEQKTGNKFVQFSKAETDSIWASNFEAKAVSCLQLAEQAKKTEGMIKILEKAAEITGYTWKH